MNGELAEPSCDTEVLNTGRRACPGARGGGMNGDVQMRCVLKGINHRQMVRPQAELRESSSSLGTQAEILWS